MKLNLVSLSLFLVLICSQVLGKNHGRRPHGKHTTYHPHHTTTAKHAGKGHSDHPSNLPVMIAAGALGTLCIIQMITLVICCRKQKKAHKKEAQNKKTILSVPQQPLTLSAAPTKTSTQVPPKPTILKSSASKKAPKKSAESLSKSKSSKTSKNDPKKSDRTPFEVSSKGDKKKVKKRSKKDSDHSTTSKSSTDKSVISKEEKSKNAREKLKRTLKEKNRFSKKSNASSTASNSSAKLKKEKKQKKVDLVALLKTKGKTQPQQPSQNALFPRQAFPAENPQSESIVSGSWNTQQSLTMVRYGKGHWNVVNQFEEDDFSFDIKSGDSKSKDSRLLMVMEKRRTFLYFTLKILMM